MAVFPKSSSTLTCSFNNQLPSPPDHLRQQSLRQIKLFPLKMHFISDCCKMFIHESTWHQPSYSPGIIYLNLKDHMAICKLEPIGDFSASYLTLNVIFPSFISFAMISADSCLHSSYIRLVFCPPRQLNPIIGPFQNLAFHLLACAIVLSLFLRTWFNYWSVAD